MQPQEPQEQPQPQQITQPSPTPESWVLNLVPAPDGSQLVVLQIMTCTGTHVSHMPCEFAEQVGSQIIAVARQGRSKLVIPPAGFSLPTPPVNGHQH